MPKRMLRDWTDSESMDSLSQGAEIFFTRLIMKADDYGCFHGNYKLLNAALFPLKGYDVYELTGWVEECVKAKLIKEYESGGKRYIQIINFGQRLRQKDAKFPQPADNCQQDVSIVRPEEKRSRREVEGELELHTAFDEIYLEKLVMSKTYPGINIQKELQMFLQKVKDSPGDYANHDTGGLRKAFNYQLRNAKPEKNGITKAIDRAQEITKLVTAKYGK